MQESTKRIIRAIRMIPSGRVSTYGGIARAAGLPNGARQVVRTLHTMTRILDLPWYRIIKSNGRIALPEGDGFELQIALLRSEGVAVTDTGLVDLEEYGFLADFK
jgi:methylated-DNA-protein-cysteine methyltransferase-like protein